MYFSVLNTGIQYYTVLVWYTLAVCMLTALKSDTSCNMRNTVPSPSVTSLLIAHLMAPLFAPVTPLCLQSK